MHSGNRFRRAVSSFNASARTHRRITGLPVLVASGLLLLVSPALATDRCGEVGGETWTIGDSPYVVTDGCGTAGVTVAAETTLTIDAGVQVRFQFGNGLQVSGTLDINGVSGSEVRFVSDAAEPQMGDWSGLQLLSGSSGTMEYALVSHASDGVYSLSTLDLDHVTLTGNTNGVRIADGTALLNEVTLTNGGNGVYVAGGTSVTLTGVTAQFNNYGLYASYTNTVIDASGCTFTDNNIYGVVSDGGPWSNTAPQLTLTGSSIHSSLGAYDFLTQRYLNAGQQRLNASGNWWGTADTGTIASRIRDHAEDVNAPLVDWCAPLLSEGGAARDVHCPDLVVCDGTEVWDQTNKPYLVSSDVVVCPTGTLQVEAGVEARVAAQASIGVEVLGTLDINGVSGSEVRFVSDAAEPQMGDWSGLQLLSGSSGTMEYALVSHASDGVYSLSTLDLDRVTLTGNTNGVRIADGTALLNEVTLTNGGNGVYVAGGTSVTLTGVTAQFNNYGLYASYTNTVIDASGCTFTDNNIYGVVSDGGPWSNTAPQLTLTGSSIHSSLGAYDFLTQRYLNAGQHRLNASGNWWGTADTGTIASRIRDHAEDVNAPLVDWCAPLLSEGGAARDVHCPDLVVCDGTEVWDQTNKPYLVSSDVVVCPTGTLQVEAGVEARVAAQASIGVEVLGTLDVNGVSGSEVRFVSDAAEPQKGDWSGLQLLSGSSGTMEYALVSHASDGVYSLSTLDLDHVTLTGNTNGVRIADGTALLNEVTLTNGGNGVYVAGGTSVTLTGVTAQFNNYGLYASYTNTVIDASGCTFTDNNIYGVVSDGGPWSNTAPQLTLTGSSIHSSLGAYDFLTQRYLNAGQQRLNASGNWWGTADTGTIASRIRDHAEDVNAPLVDWCAPLLSEGGAARDVHCPDLVVCDGTEVWDQTNKPYLVSSDVVVCPTGTLQVEAGVEARVAAQASIGVEVLGTLDVNGVSGSEVRFVSDAAEPQKGDWSGLQLLSGSSGTMEYALVSHASDGVYSLSTLDLDRVTLTGNTNGVRIADGTALLNEVTLTNGGNGVYVAGGTSVTLTGVTAQFNNYGLYASYTNTVIDASGCTFTDNNIYGVVSDGGPWSNTAPQLTLTGSSIHSSLGAYDFLTQRYLNASSTLVWAPDNWWGTTSEERIRQRIYDREDSSSSPIVHFQAFGPSCEIALGRDTDNDRLGDFDDNCPVDRNSDQTDTDGDRMGDACDPEPGTLPPASCDGIDDEFDGYADADGDGWGDPCDFHPTRADCHPGAPEICDGRDNDGDAAFALDELADADLDGAIACGDCDDTEPEVYPCACESCINLREDDCDGLMDGADPECFENPYCVVVTASTPEPEIHVDIGVCGGAELSGPFDVIRGHVSQVQLSGGSVDLGNVDCVEGGLNWDRVTNISADPNPQCNDTALYFLARDSGAADFGAAYPGSEPRDVMHPDPPCP